MLRAVIRIFKMSTHPVYLTYFIFISLHGHVDIVLFLLQNGANTELCDETLNWGNWNSGFVKLGVRWAEWDRDHESFNLKIHETFCLLTLFHLTYFIFISLHGHVDIVRFLLQNGANTELCDDWNCTPLHNAAGAGHYQIVDLLCEAGARLDARASNKGKTKVTRIF